MSNSLLVVDQDWPLANQICSYFGQRRWKTDACKSAEEALSRVAAHRPDLILAEHRLPELTGSELAGRIAKDYQRIPLVVMSADHSAQTAVRAMKAGACDYLPKPVALPDMLLAFEKILAAGSSPRSPRLQPPPQPPPHPTIPGIAAILGNSPPMQELKEAIRQLHVAGQGMSGDGFPAVLVLGETGTGKELVARALHANVPGRNGELVEINCASIPMQLLEAELFGYRKGAFTDAQTDKPGLIEAAEDGTLFLDEIGEVDLTIQAKLLKLLDDKTYRPLGSVHEKQANLRIVSATNRDLEKMVRQGLFRSDLYFRLRVISLKVPPLRTRGDDILLLARHFVAMHGRRYGNGALRFDAEAEQVLVQYDWPGNVRELRNMLEQVVFSTPGKIISARQLKLSPVRFSAASPVSTNDIYDFDLPAAEWGVRLSAANKQAMLQALAETGWNVAQTARRLGLTRDKMRYRIEQMKLGAIENRATVRAGDSASEAG